MSRFDEALREIAEKLWGGLNAADAVSAATLHRAEARLGVRLPQHLFSFLRVAGRNAIVAKAQNRFLSAAKIHRHNGGLVFLEENQKVVFWAVKLDDLNAEDPPVFQGNPNENEWYRDADSLAGFLLDMTCFQAAVGLSDSAGFTTNDELLERFGVELSRPRLQVLDETTDLLCFYGQGVVVAASRSAKEAFVGARDEAALQRFERSFELELERS